MDTEEVSDRFVAPCFVNRLEAYDGEINLGVEENMISNEYAVKLCLEHEVKRGNKVVKKELIVVLRGKFYFVKFIINLEEDDVEPREILGRSFLHMTKAITDFGAGTVTIYPEIDPFLKDIEEEEKRTSSSAGGHLTQEEAAKKALAIRMSQKFALLEEERPIIKTMAYHDKYKKILDDVWKDKVELDGKIVKEEEEAVKKIKGEALKEKDDLRAFIFPIRLEGQVKQNALADTGSDINTMPYRIYEQLGREEMKKFDRGIKMINHTQAEAMGILTNVLCQVGVTTLIAKFLILDIPIDRDSPIVVGRGFLPTIGGIVNTPERLFSTFDGFCHQTFRAARSDVMRNPESDSDDEEEYQIKRNKFGAPIYGPKPAPYLNCNDPAERSLAIQTVTNPFWKISVWKKAVSFLGSLPVPLKHVNWKPDYKGCYTKEEEATRQWRTDIRRFGTKSSVELEEEGFNVYFEGGLHSDEHFNAHDYWLSISQEENLGLSRSHTSTIKKPILRVIHKMITYGLCQRTTRKRAGTQKESQICCGQFISKIARKCRVLTEDVSSVPRVGIPRPPRASMQDLYDRMGRMEIR
ncbi:ribonuclease H-like domain-containing protein [Tanacetum coccineum]